jgi:hypothetical protein
MSVFLVIMKETNAMSVFLVIMKEIEQQEIFWRWKSGTVHRI